MIFPPNGDQLEQYKLAHINGLMQERRNSSA